MIKVLLVAVNAKYIHSNPAVYSLQAYAKKQFSAKEHKQCRIEIVEYTINQRREELIADIYRKKPDLLAFSCYIWNWNRISRMLPSLHKLLRETEIWLGGPEVSFTPEKILGTYPFLTGIMIGEGEVTFTQLCQRMIRRRAKWGKGEQNAIGAKSYPKSLEQETAQLPGVVTKEGWGAMRGLTPLDEIPFFYQDMDQFQNRIVYYESSRGCPYRCQYCLSAIDKEMRLRRMDLVKEELLFFLEQKVLQVKFIDRTFNANGAHAREIWQFLAKHDNGVTNFHFEIAADILQEEDLVLLGGLRPGLVQLEIGVQSTNEETLQEILRPMNFPRLATAVQRLQENKNIHLHLDLIAGLPKEGYERFGLSFDQVYQLQPHQLQLGFLKVLKGSPLWERADAYGIVYEEEAPYEVLFTHWLSYAELRRLKKIEEVLEIFYNSGQFLYTIAMLEKEFTSPFVFYETLAQFWEKKGQLSEAHARNQRYDFLLKFIQEYTREKEEMYVELLTFDLYLREKVKTRPAFCPGEERLRGESRAFYQWEEGEGKYLPSYRGYQSKQLAKMTHLEGFTYGVWNKGDCRKLPEQHLILFDYQNRNPLTKAARIQEVSQWKSVHKDEGVKEET